jgi:hypothetical protein
MEKISESKEEMNLRFSECERLIELNKGKKISQESYNYINELSKGGFRTLQQKSKDDTMITTMQRKYENGEFGNKYTFFVEESK